MVTSRMTEDLDAWLDRVDSHARDACPEECCGLLLRRSTRGRICLEAHPCRNLQAELNARDPSAHPRTAATGYYLDPACYLRVAQGAGERGAALVAVYHSHVEASAELSPLDRELVAPGGRPWQPELAQLVLSVVAGRVRERRLYAWDDAERSFREVAMSWLYGGPSPPSMQVART